MSEDLLKGGEERGQDELKGGEQMEPDLLSPAKSDTDRAAS